MPQKEKTYYFSCLYKIPESIITEYINKGDIKKKDDIIFEFTDKEKNAKKDDKEYGRIKAKKSQIDPNKNGVYYDASIINTFIYILKKDIKTNDCYINACRELSLSSFYGSWNICIESVLYSFFDKPDLRETYPHNDFFSNAELLSERDNGWIIDSNIEIIRNKQNETLNKLKLFEIELIRIYKFNTIDETVRETIDDVKKDINDIQKKDGFSFSFNLVSEFGIVNTVRFNLNNFDFIDYTSENPKNIFKCICKYSVTASPSIKEKVKELCTNPSLITLNESICIENLFPEDRIFEKLKNIEISIGIFSKHISKQKINVFSFTQIKNINSLEINRVKKEKPFFYRNTLCLSESFDDYNPSLEISVKVNSRNNFLINENKYKNDIDLQIFEDHKDNKVIYLDAASIALKDHRFSRLYFIYSNELKENIKNNKNIETDCFKCLLEASPSESGSDILTSKFLYTKAKFSDAFYITTRIIWKNSWSYIIICNDYYLNEKELPFYINTELDEYSRCLFEEINKNIKEKIKWESLEPFDYFYRKESDIEFFDNEKIKEEDTLLLSITSDAQGFTPSNKNNNVNTTIRLESHIMYVSSLVDDTKVFEQLIIAIGVLKFCKKTNDLLEENSGSLQKEFLILLPEKGNKNTRKNTNSNLEEIEILLRMKRKLKSIERKIRLFSSGTTPERKVYSYYLRKNYCEEYLSDSIEEIDSIVNKLEEQLRLEEREKEEKKREEDRIVREKQWRDEDEKREKEKNEREENRLREEKKNDEANMRTTTVLALLSIFAIPSAYLALFDILDKTYSLLEKQNWWKVFSSVFSFIMFSLFFGLTVTGFVVLINTLSNPKNRNRDSLEKAESSQNIYNKKDSGKTLTIAFWIGGPLITIFVFIICGFLNYYGVSYPKFVSWWVDITAPIYTLLMHWLNNTIYPWLINLF